MKLQGKASGNGKTTQSHATCHAVSKRRRRPRYKPQGQGMKTAIPMTQKRRRTQTTETAGPRQRCQERYRARTACTDRDAQTTENEHQQHATYRQNAALHCMSAEEEGKTSASYIQPLAKASRTQARGATCPIRPRYTDLQRRACSVANQLLLVVADLAGRRL